VTPLVLTAVVRDRFNAGFFSVGFKNSICSSAESSEGWLRLLERLAADFACSPCFGDFVSALARVQHSIEPEIQRGFNSGYGLTEVLLTRPLDWLKAAGGHPSPITLMQWMHLVEVVEGLVKIRIFVDRHVLSTLSHFDIADVFQAVVAEPVGSPFRTTAAAFISRLLKDSNWQDGTPWALLRLALSRDFDAEKLLQRWPLESIPYLNLLALPGVDLTTTASVLSCFPNLRVLHDSRVELSANVFRRIVDSSRYRMPSDPALALKEYR
jgi:hypothetical protein